MKLTKSQNRRYCIIFFVVSTIILFFCFLIGIGERKNDKLIEANGIKGVCMVTLVRATNRFSEGGEHLSVRYEYKVGGELYSYSKIYGSWEHLQDAIVGMKYEIKYLEEAPQKSIIYIDHPIVSEYKNIEEERKKMKATGKYKRGLEDAEPIESIKARYPEYFR